MLTSIIVAIAKNRVIGLDGGLPWHLPEDLKFFSKTTTGHCVLLGRKNFESIPEKYRPLPNRTNIVLTRQENFAPNGVVVVHDFASAIEHAKDLGETELFIIGGAEIYGHFIDLADRMYITEIDGTPEGDTLFPSFEESQWEKKLLYSKEKDAVHSHAFKTYLLIR